MAGASNGAANAAKTPIGTVGKASGTVEVIHPDGSKGVLHVGDVVYQGDVIVTGGDGAVGITFADASTFALGKSGRMTIDDLVYDPASDAGHSALSVVKGAFSYASGHIAKTAPEAATLKTPVMTIGIRGTTVAGVAAAEGEENAVSLLQDQDGGTGQIVITNASGSVVLNSTNQTLQLFSSYQPPPPPTVMTLPQIQVLYDNVHNSLPPQPAPSTPPQVIVPGYTPPPPPSNTPGNAAPEQHGSAPNDDHPIVGYQTPVSIPQPQTTSVQQQLEHVQHEVIQGSTSGNQQSASTTQGTGTTGDKTLEGVNSSNDDGIVPGADVSGDDTPAPNGRAIDGYVANVTVFRDLNNDGVQNNGEVSTTTNGSGQYYLSGSGGTIVVKAGGTDSTTGKPLAFDMKAPDGASVVTPLTTMMVALTNAGISDAQSVVCSMLGLSASASLTSYDPVATFDKTVLAAIAKVAATVNAMASAMTTAGANSSAAANAVFYALADWASSNSTHLGTFSLTDTTTLTTILSSALSHAALSPSAVDSAVLATVLAVANTNIGNAFATATSLNDSSLITQLQSALTSDGSLTDIINSGLAPTTDQSGHLLLSGHGDLTDVNLSMCNHLTVSGGDATLSLAQWDSLSGKTSISVDNGYHVLLVVKADANLTQSHSGLAASVADGTISRITVETGVAVTLDAATLLAWIEHNQVTLSTDADVTVVGDASALFSHYAYFANTYIDHFATPAAPMAEVAAAYKVASGGTFTISAHDLNGDTLTYTASATAHGGTLVNLGNGQFSYTPPQSYSGADTFTVTISDGTSSVQQKVAVMVTSETGSPSVYPFTGDALTAPVQGEWVDARFSLHGSGSAVVTVVVYLGSNGDGMTGALRVGSTDAGCMWTMTGTVEAINQALAGLQYQAPATVTANGSDFINIAVYDGTKASVGNSGFTVHYTAPEIFTGDVDTAWTTAANWSNGTPANNSAVVIDANNITNSTHEAIVDSASTLSMKNLQVLHGATLTVAGDLALNGNSFVYPEISSGTIDSASSLHVSGNGTLANNGILNLAGTITVDSGASFTNLGTLEIGGQADGGAGFGTATVHGSIDFSFTSIVVLEIGCDGQSLASDKLVFDAGPVALAGRVLVNVDPLTSFATTPTTFTLITGVDNIDYATFGITNNSAPLAIVGIEYDAGTDKVSATVESFDSNHVASYGCGGGQDFVFGATGLHNLIYDINGTDHATGGALDDTFVVGADTAWVVDGGGGNDTLTLTAGNTYDIDDSQVTSIETFNIAEHTSVSSVALTLHHGADATITGIGTNDMVYGGAEKDTFVVSQDDFGTISGGAGDDTLVAAGMDIDLSGPNVLVSSIEKLQVNTTADTSPVRLTLDAAGVQTMSDTDTVTVSFNGGKETDDLLLSGVWHGTGYMGGNMTFTSENIHGTATVNVTVPTGADTSVAAKMMGSDGTHVKTTVTAGTDDVLITAGTGMDYIRGADQHRNEVDDIGYGDYVYGGSKDDTFIATADSFSTIAGGSGNDTLMFNDGTFSLTSSQVSGVENFDLRGYLVDLTIDSNVTQNTTSNKVTIFCDDPSSIHVNGAVSSTGNDVDQTHYSVYTFANGSTVEVQSPVPIP